MTISEFIILVICPLVGIVLGISMFMSNVFNLRKQKAFLKGLGEVNPIPYSTIFGNCVGGCIYAVIHQNQWVWWNNFPGVLIGLHLCCESITICNHHGKDIDVRNNLLRNLKFWVAFWLLTGWTLAFVCSPAASANIIGFISSAVCVTLYASPLTTVFTVLREWDASSLYLPMCLIATTCTLLWTVYGLAIGDGFVWGPNLAGLCLSMIQLTLVTLLPSRGHPAYSETDKQSSVTNDIELGYLTSSVNTTWQPVEKATVVAAKVLTDGAPADAIHHKPDLGPIAEIPPFAPASYPNDNHSSFEYLTSHRAQHSILANYGGTLSCNEGSTTIGSTCSAPSGSAFSGATLECAICLTSISCSVEPHFAGSAEEKDESTSSASTAVELRCGHRFCTPCMKKCAANDLASCPTCRHPHELDPIVLQDRLDAFRGNYHNWRKGGTSGAKGEVDDISAAAPTRTAVESTF
jgi:solute carrier family 50 protein (sugar transporter)